MLYLIFSEEGGKKRMTPFMEWNLNCLRAIAELRTPLLDTLMQGVTELGGETLFMHIKGGRKLGKGQYGK